MNRYRRWEVKKLLRFLCVKHQSLLYEIYLPCAEEISTLFHKSQVEKYSAKGYDI